MSDATPGGMVGALIPWDELDTDGRIKRLAFEIESLRYQIDGLRRLVETTVRGVENICDRLSDVEGRPFPEIMGRA